MKSKLGVRVIKCNETKPRRSFRQKRDNIKPDHKAFFLCINKADSQLLLDPAKWPADVVSAWFFKKKDDDAKSTPTEAAAVVSDANKQHQIVVEAVIHSDQHAAAAVADGTNGNGIGNGIGNGNGNVDNGMDGNGNGAEAMTLSPINGNQSDEFSEAIELDDDITDHNSTSIAVVDLPSIVLP